MSASSGPFKSRLLSFINRQFLHVSTQLEKTVRHVRVSAEWGMQTLLYPVYLLVQSGRTVANRLNQTTASNAIAVSSPDADRPVEKILEVAQPILAASATQVARRLPEKLKGRKSVYSNQIQGVATLLETRELVLVVKGNHLINILSQEQQHKLRQRIIEEMANYWYTCRSLAPKTRRLPTFKRNRANVLAPVRFFWGVMRWIQGSPVAIALNLFGESTLVRPRLQSPQLTPPNWGSLARPERLDQPPLTVTPEMQPTSRLPSLIRAAIDYFFGGARKRRSNQPPELPTAEFAALSSQSAFPSQTSPALAGNASRSDELPALPTTNQSSPRWWNAIPSASSKLTQTLKRLKHQMRSPQSGQLTIAETDPFHIRVLIRSAVDYFFGRQQTALSGQPSLLPPTPPQPQTDSWLGWEDLFEEVALADERRLQPVPTAIDAPIKSGRTVLNKLRSYVKPKPVDSALLEAEVDASSLQNHSAQATTEKNPIVPAPHATLESSPEWIETSATKIGYIKHPLERILEWLDRIMLWLEELVVGIWHRVRQQG